MGLRGFFRKHFGSKNSTRSIEENYKEIYEENDGIKSEWVFR